MAGRPTGCGRTSASTPRPTSPSSPANRRPTGSAWPPLDFAAARLIVSIGADFLDGLGRVRPAAARFRRGAREARERAAVRLHRRPRRSLTGLNADEWIACRPGSELAIANALAGRRRARRGGDGERRRRASADNAWPHELRREAEPRARPASTARCDALARSPPPRSIRRPAPSAPRSSPPRRSRVRRRRRVADAGRASSGCAPVRSDRLRARREPGLHAPQALRVRRGAREGAVQGDVLEYPDETTELCDLILPDHHPLESWGDARAVRGTCRSSSRRWIRCSTPARPPTCSSPSARAPATAARYPGGLPHLADPRFPGGATALHGALTQGWPRARRSPARARRRAPRRRRRARRARRPAGDFYLVVYPSPVLGDGRGANKPWLQELPDPVSKVCGSSWVEIHPSAAARLGIGRRRHVEVTTAAGHRGAGVPLPGHRVRRRRRRDGDRSTGHTAIWAATRRASAPIRSMRCPGAYDARGGLAWTSARRRVAKTGEHERLVTTEGSARQHGRGIAQALTAAQLGRAAGLKPRAPASHRDGVAEFSCRPALAGRRRRAG